MPCNSYYMEPNERQKAHQRAANMLLIVRDKLHITVDQKLLDDSRNEFCETDYVGELCHILRSISPDVFERVVYTGRDPDSRKVADWWEEHLLYDSDRQLKKLKELLSNTKFTSPMLFTVSEAVRAGLGNDKEQLLKYLIKEFLSETKDDVYEDEDFSAVRSETLLEQLRPSILISWSDRLTIERIKERQQLTRRYGHRTLLVTGSRRLLPALTEHVDVYVDITMADGKVLARVDKLRGPVTHMFYDPMYLTHVSQPYT